MSCCGGNYGCKMYPDLIQENSAASETFVVGVLPPQKGRLEELDEMAAGSENGGCKCGSNCTCDPCNCDPCNCK